MKVQTSAIALMAGLAAGTAWAQQPGEGLEEIVVTAQKRAESLQDTPISIVAFRSEELETKGINSLVDLRANVPNLQLTPHPNSAASTLLFLRGVGLNDDQITQDSGVAVYVDGVYVARSQGLAMDVADIARIEVLRGPQGTLYGRNATGGAVNFVTRAPDLGKWGFKQQLSLGSRDLFRSKTTLNLPVGQTLAARLSYLKAGEDGFVRNAGTSVERFGDQDREAWRADLLWQPADALSLRYAYDRSEIGDTPAFIARVPLFPATAPRPSQGSAAVAGLQPNDVTSQGHSLTAAWELAPETTLKSITAYRRLSNFQNEDYHSGVLSANPLFRNSSLSHQKQWSEELQLVGGGPDSALQYVAGFYYFSESGDNGTRTVTPSSGTVSTSQAGIDNSSYAVFGQATWTPDWLDRRLHLTAGARWSRDMREADLLQSTLVTATGVTTTGTPGHGDRSFAKFTPSAIIAYDVTGTVNVYGKVVRGYKTGGFNVRASSIARFNQGFGEETLTSYEVGVKSQVWQDRVRFNLAGFRSRYKDIQVNVQSDPANIRLTDVLNAGRATIQGIEADLTARLAPGLTLALNYGYLDAGYDRITNASGQNVAQAYRFINSPRHSYTVDVTYVVPPLPFGVLTVNAGYTWQDSKFAASTIDQGTYLVGAYGLLNARATLSDLTVAEGLKLAVWGRNLTDKTYYVAHFNGGVPSAVFGAPRSVGVDLSFEF